jgi:hypothetical protein
MGNKEIENIPNYAILSFKNSTKCVLCMFMLCLNLPAFLLAQTNNNDKNSLKSKITIGETASPFAPVFVNGRGGGSYGKTIYPIIPISEEEAKEIIFNTLENAGLFVDTENTKKIDLEVYPLVNIRRFPYHTDSLLNPPLSAKINIRFDGKIRDYDFYVKYVDQETYKQFKLTEEEEELSFPPIISDIDTIDGEIKIRAVMVYLNDADEGFSSISCAKELRSAILSQTKEKAVIFYSPFCPFIRSSDEMSNWVEKSDIERKKIIKEFLKQQVLDFIKWLKSKP